MREEILKVLAGSDVPRELEQFRLNLMNLMRMSRSTMKEYYPLWDRNDAIYRGERAADESDIKARKRNEPAKVFVPLTQSQVNTFVSFSTMMLTQRDYFYELGGRGPEDAKPAEFGMAVLERDLEENKFTGVLLPQFLTDIGRFGIGIMKSQFVRETQPVPVQVPDPKWRPVPNLPGAQQQPPMITQWQAKTSYLGNRISVVNPYRWFPDVRLPITRFSYGEFCGDEIEYSRNELNKMEQDGLCAGVEFIPALPDDAYNDRRSFYQDGRQNPLYNPTIDPKFASHFVLITEIEIKLNPSKTFIDEGVALDPDLDADVIYIVWIANDGRIIRIEDSGYEHNQFCYDAAQFFNDQLRVVNFGIAELIGPMQDIMDWLLNSRVTNVRKVIQNQLVVDPRYVDMEDLKARNPVIRLKGTVDGLAINNYIQQLNVTDVTTGHLTDMAVIKDLSQDATGLSNNLVGQYAEGRRSAREASNVNANAASRVILPVKGIWQSALLPLGRKLLKNAQQNLDEEQLVSVVGLAKVASDPMTVAAFLPVDKTQLVGTYDFLVFDDTLPSQRTAMAGYLQEVGALLSAQPMQIFGLNLDPQLLLYEWFKLVGIRNPERFALTPERLAQLAAMAGIAGNPGGAGGVGPTQQGGGQNVQSQPGRVQTNGSTAGAAPVNGSNHQPHPAASTRR
jgi:hypothetical protein